MTDLAFQTGRAGEMNKMCAPELQDEKKREGKTIGEKRKKEQIEEKNCCCSSCGSNVPTSRETKQSFVNANGLSNHGECMCVAGTAVMMSESPISPYNEK